jgi:flagellar protein FliO/FliZ
MDVLLLIRAVAALAVVLGLVGLAAYAARRWGPAGLLQIKPASRRRLSIVESLTLDPQRRLVLIRCDAEERLLLLGEGRTLDVRPHAPPERSVTP